MNNRDVHADTHPSGHPNKTAVNAENPIFGRPADPIPAVSFQQAAVVQSEKHPRVTVQSPLLSEADLSSVLPSAAELGAMQAAGEKPSEEPVVENTETLPEQSAEDLAAVRGTEQAQESSPSAEATAGETEHSQIGAGLPETLSAAVVSQFASGQKVRFMPECGNDTEPVYTIDGGELGQGEDALWFWRLVEIPGLFLGENLMPAGPEEV